MNLLFSNRRDPMCAVPPDAGSEPKRPQNEAGHALRCAGRGGNASSASAAVGVSSCSRAHFRARLLIHLPGVLLVCVIGLAAALLRLDRLDAWCQERLS